MSLQEVFNAVAGFFANFSWVYAVEFVLFFLLIYFVLRILRSNDAKIFIFTYCVVLVLAGVVCIFTPYVERSPVLFPIIFLLLSMTMLLLFNVEVKRTAHNGKKIAPALPVERDGGVRHTQEEAEACIESIIRALQNMSKNAVGALLVLSGGNLPKHILESGTTLNADISQQLIEGIFFPKAPLHDGAVIIEEYTVRAAGCFLPLTQNNEKYPQELGTRHRAGIGITEIANVVSLIVSEETGVISIVQEGKVSRYADATMLRKTLREYYWKDIEQPQQRRGRNKKK